jgi:hypothetical protein
LLLLSPSSLRVFGSLLDNAMSTFGRTPLMSGINELRAMFLTDWWTYYGLSLLLGLIGGGIAASQLGNGGRRRRWAMGLLTVGCAVAILASNDIGARLHRAPTGDIALPDGGVLAGLIRVFVLPIWFLASVHRRTAPWSAAEPSGRRALFFFLTVWWLVLLASASGAWRHNFFLVPIGWVLAGHGLSVLLGLGAARHRTVSSAARREPALVIGLIALWLLALTGSGPPLAAAVLRGRASHELLLIIALSVIAILVVQRPPASGATPVRFPWAAAGRRTASLILLGFLLVPSALQARAVAAKLGPVQGWLYPFLEDLGPRLPLHAVVLAWRDYGSYINVLAHRATMIDEDDYASQARVREVVRETYCSDSAPRAADFLARNGVTHWLIADFDMDILPRIALVAGVNASPSELQIITFSEPQNRPALPSGLTRLLPNGQGPPRLFDRLTLEGLGRPRGPLYLSEILVKRAGAKSDPSGTPPDVAVVVSTGLQHRLLRPETVVLQGRTIRYHGAVLPGMLRVEGPTAGRPVTASYFPKRVSRFLAARLFVAGEEFPQFRPLGAARLRIEHTEGDPVARVWAVTRPTVTASAARMPQPINRPGPTR